MPEPIHDPAETRANALVRLEGVKLSFDNGRVAALNGVDLAVFPGEQVAIVGRSGSGKSSLANVMTGIVAPTQGQVFWRGEGIRDQSRWRDIRRAQIGIVFQEFNLLPTLSAVENLDIVLFGCGLGAARRRALASEALSAVGLGARLNHLPSALSGGERQRVAIARAIVHRPALLVADEPTGSLDTANGELVADLLFDLQARHAMTLAIVTHDERLAARCARIVRLLDGRIVDQGACLEAAAPARAASP